ncbi:MAG: NUDIX domain-containing protein [Defluviitaleaceae bacterium]|nr:NUDIX domain-containing protein [Defluviitaleaceae bacterium]MCL2274685.1 NUDIX domain-containing protein [Defluviitaleaceae bacterium]MCL2275754.1 NUDIX domain-containing protein [Defluviitaleaceae bacterium]
MPIRSTAKAIIQRENKILLNKCTNKIGDYYELPGGGQNQYETLHEAIKRECLEETGYAVTPIRFAALCETIHTNEAFKQQYPEYMHMIFHIFICRLLDDAPTTPTEKDLSQTGCEWVDINLINTPNHPPLFPTAVGDNIKSIIASETPVFLGSAYNDLF